MFTRYFSYNSLINYCNCAIHGVVCIMRVNCNYNEIWSECEWQIWPSNNNWASFSNRKWNLPKIWRRNHSECFSQTMCNIPICMCVKDYLKWCNYTILNSMHITCRFWQKIQFQWQKVWRRQSAKTNQIFLSDGVTTCICKNTRYKYK